jgi:protease-4
MNDNIPGSERNNANNGSSQQALVNQLAREFLAEQRSSRRWGIFFKLLIVIFLFSFLLVYLTESMDINEVGSGKHTALVDISGEIAADSQASADNVLAGIRAAFRHDNTAGLILRINSPGGSPVQAGHINDEINRLRKLHPDVPVYAVLEDTCASGGYYIAVAADMIYADKASLVGSIGVIMSGFGYVEAMEKLGIERRILHAGESKAFLDAFSPLKEGDVEHVDKLLIGIYQQFIEIVKQGRGDRLTDDKIIFSGLVWTGEQSIELGLVDALGNAAYVAREIIGVERIVNFTRRESYLDRLARGIGTTLANKLVSIGIYNVN